MAKIKTGELLDRSPLAYVALSFFILALTCSVRISLCLVCVMSKVDSTGRANYGPIGHCSEPLFFYLLNPSTALLAKLEFFYIPLCLPSVTLFKPGKSDNFSKTSLAFLTSPELQLSPSKFFSNTRQILSFNPDN